MKAVSPVRHPNRKALASGCCCGGGAGGGGGGGSDGGGGGGGGELPLGFLADPGCLKGSSALLGEAEEPASLCLQCDMNDCYSRLRKLVPTIPPHKRVSKVEILQHVIDYILDLQLALETHPALLRQQQQQPLQQQQQTQQQQQQQQPHQAPRTPLTALNVDPAGAVNKQGDSILCR